MNKGTKSADGKYRTNLRLEFRIGAAEIAECVEFAFTHGSFRCAANSKLQTLASDIEAYLLKESKLELDELVKDVLQQEGESFEMQNWDNDLTNTDRERFEQIAFDRYKREFDL